VKEFRKLANICQRYGQLQSGTFFSDTVYTVWLLLFFVFVESGILLQNWICA